MVNLIIKLVAIIATTAYAEEPQIRIADYGTCLENQAACTRAQTDPGICFRDYSGCVATASGDIGQRMQSNLRGAVNPSVPAPVFKADEGAGDLVDPFVPNYVEPVVAASPAPITTSITPVLTTTQSTSQELLNLLSSTAE